MTVYLIYHPGDHALKIGFTDGDPEDRLRFMQTGSASPLELVNVIPGASRSVEGYFHRQFSHFRIRGEWFADTEVVRAAFSEYQGRDHRRHLWGRVRETLELLETLSDDATTESIVRTMGSARSLLDENACGCVGRRGALDGVVPEHLGTVRAFWDEFADSFVWDLLPFPFLYELYKAWFPTVSPSGSPVSRQQFVADLVAIIRDEPDWHCPDKNRKHRPGLRMDAPEHLIAEYDLKSWYAPNYSGDDLDIKCRPLLRENYRGVLRRRRTIPPPRA